MPTRSTSFAAVIALAAVTVGSPAVAEYIPPSHSYRFIVGGGKYIFVMLDPTRREESNYWRPETPDRVRQIHRTYSRSGLYRNDGSTEPLWTVEWFVSDYWNTPSVHIALDGVHMIRPGRWVTSLEREGVDFYADGKLLRSYTVRELVSDPASLSRTGGGRILWLEDCGFTSSGTEYTLRTNDGNRFVFDVRTGEIISEYRPARVRGWGAATVVVGVAGWLVWRRLRLTSVRRRPSHP
jgi:hypothetical protein